MRNPASLSDGQRDLSLAVPGYALAARGQPPAAPPDSVMNSRGSLDHVASSIGGTDRAVSIASANNSNDHVAMPG